jgi:hypothetical protein
MLTRVKKVALFSSFTKALCKVSTGLLPEMCARVDIGTPVTSCAGCLGEREAAGRGRELGLVHI